LSKIPLPVLLEDLRKKVRKFFPITECKDLQDIPKFRTMLKKYYKVDRISDNYFVLPPEKPWLLPTFQELNSATREFFPCSSENNTKFRKLLNKLREHYKFDRIPKDYFIQKRRLSEKPQYRVVIPLPLNYMSINPTDKEQLPEDLEEIDKANITIPIRSAKMLIETTRLLKKHYFFHKLPNEWIDIEKKGMTEDEKSALPKDINKINVALKNSLADNKDTIP
ncbi:16169_t:CDS:2, partial [Gigaspora rosea]